MDKRLKEIWSGALCATLAPYDPRWNLEGASNEDERRALAHEMWNLVCADCPVWESCLEWATKMQEAGIWAGTTPLERSRLICGRTAMSEVTER